MMLQEDYYYVLKVDPNSSRKVIHWNFQRLQEIIDPEVCEDALGDAALEIVHKAYTTLITPWKKTLYNQYLTQPHGDQTFHAWLKKGPSIPGWVQGMLDCPCGAAIGLLIFTPITTLLFLLWLLFRISVISCRVFIKGDHNDSAQEDLLFFGTGEEEDVANYSGNNRRIDVHSTCEEEMRSNGASDVSGGKLGVIDEGVDSNPEEFSVEP